LTKIAFDPVHDEKQFQYHDIDENVDGDSKNQEHRKINYSIGGAVNDFSTENLLQEMFPFIFTSAFCDWSAERKRVLSAADAIQLMIRNKDFIFNNA
jgi:hypothetical protein